MWESSNSEADVLNYKAFGALLGLSQTPREDLAALLRSGAPIGVAVREQMASAIEGKGFAGISLTLEGHESQQRRALGLDSRKKWLSFGERIYPFVKATGRLSTDAFALAADKFEKKESYCKNCFYYYKNYLDWVEIAKSSGEFFSAMHEEQLQFVWHIAAINQSTIKPKPPSGPEYDRIFRDRVAFFRSITDGDRPWPDDLSKMFISTMLVYCDLAPPD